jgi:hypothetical protein
MEDNYQRDLILDANRHDLLTKLKDCLPCFKQNNQLSIQQEKDQQANEGNERNERNFRIREAP